MRASQLVSKCLQQHICMLWGPWVKIMLCWISNLKVAQCLLLNRRCCHFYSQAQMKNFRHLPPKTTTASLNLLLQDPSLHMVTRRMEPILRIFCCTFTVLSNKRKLLQVQLVTLLRFHKWQQQNTFKVLNTKRYTIRSIFFSLIDVYISVLCTHSVQRKGQCDTFTASTEGSLCRTRSSLNVGL